MGTRDTSFTTTAPLLLRNSITSLFVFADNLLFYVARKSKLLRLIRRLFTSAFLFFLRLLPSLFPSLNHNNNEDKHHRQPSENGVHAPPFSVLRRGDSGIGRALSQLLSIVNTIPVSSRKYDVVRSLAEKLIDENHAQGHKALREVNRTVLSAAFARNLSQFEDAAEELESSAAAACVESLRSRPVLNVFRKAWSRIGSMRKKVIFRLDRSAEKLVAELLWLAQKMAACGCADEAVSRWASASNLARLSLTMEPRLQGSLVKISAFLFKHTKDVEDKYGGSKTEQCRQMKMNMLMSWLPLLCIASNGTDAPVLSIKERAELEKVLEETIEMLELEEEQEGVLSLWLHYFMHCPSSDWPNLQSSYVRWFSSSRRLLVKSDKL